MTTTRHRAEQDMTDAPDTEAHNAPRGRGPHGMWWVAWRQHRIAVIAALGAIAVLAGSLLVFAARLRAFEVAGGCAFDGVMPTCPDSVYQSERLYSFQTTWRFLQAAALAAPALVGVIAAVGVFAREFERGTHVFALTQSVGRLLWWATKATVVGVPVVGGLVGLGFVTSWVIDRNGMMGSTGPLDDGLFQIRGVMPAAFGLIALAVALTAGILIRSTVPALVAGLIVTGVLIVGVGFLLRPHLLTPDRVVTPVSESPYGTLSQGIWYLGAGNLDAHGNEVTFDFQKCAGLPDASATSGAGEPATSGAGEPTVEEQWDACQKQQGIVASFVDYLPASKASLLQAVEAAICAAIAALFLAAGFLRLRVLPRSRS